MSEILRYCKEHETWEDGYPFYCDTVSGLNYDGKIIKKVRKLGRNI